MCDTGNAAVGAPGGHGEPARHGQRRRARRGAAHRRSTRACSAARPRTRSPPWCRCSPRCATPTATPRSGPRQHPDLAGGGLRPETFRSDAGLADGESLLGSGTVSDMLWARPARHDPRHRLPARWSGRRRRSCRSASARLNLRIPPGTEPGRGGGGPDEHLRAAAPWGVARRAWRPRRRASRSGPTPTVRRTRRCAAAMKEAYGRDMVAARPGRLDPAVQRVRRDLSRRRAAPDGRRGAAGAHPRPQRERRIPTRSRAWPSPRRSSCRGTARHSHDGG